ncbi:MAG: hypothetical protein GF381_03515 [Candidatus Pacebacteria bacterium]|nr:hypothetical protein [Candidatus Paceibacterota bacterium]
MNKFKKALSTVSASVTAMAMAASPVSAQLGEVEVPDEGFADSIGSLITALLNFVMLIAALLVFMYLIWGGIEWITSGGDKSKTESARNKITAAIIGLIVLAASYAILQLALNFLGFEGGLQDLFNDPPSLD